MTTHGAAAVRRIRPDEGPALRTLRLAALSTDPLAFGSTLEREREFPEPKWRERAEAGSSGRTEVLFFLADPERPPHGMLGAFTEDRMRKLWGMWVAPARRREGGGEALLRAVLRWCDGLPGGGAVGLDVNPDQAAAVRLYERHGFRRCEDDRPLGHHPPTCRFAMRRDAEAAPPVERG